MKITVLKGVMAAGFLPLVLSAPLANADFIYKQFDCPSKGKTVVPTGSRFEINDIIISTNKNQDVTLKFQPGNRIFTKVFMKAKEPFQTNLSGQVASEDQQALLLSCDGNANTTLTVTITGNSSL